MAEYNIDNLSQDEILDLISSRFSIKEIEELEGYPLCGQSISQYFYHEVDCTGKGGDFCNSCLFGCKARPKLLNLLRHYKDIDSDAKEEERERGRGILMKSYSKDSSISSILKRIKI